MTEWNYNIPARTYGATQPAAPAADVVAPQASPATDTLGASPAPDMQKIIQDLASYSAYPGFDSVAAIIVNLPNPADREAKLQEMSDAIDQVRANPHRDIPGLSPEVANVIERVREAELQKPDPLNLLRPDANEASTMNTRTMDAVVENFLLGTSARADDMQTNARLLDEWRRPTPSPIGPIIQPFAAIDSVSVAVNSGNSVLGALDAPSVPDVRAAMGIALNTGGRGQA